MIYICSYLFIGLLFTALWVEDGTFENLLSQTLYLSNSETSEFDEALKELNKELDIKIDRDKIIRVILTFIITLTLIVLWPIVLNDN
jgi:hypothetical protein